MKSKFMPVILFLLCLIMIVSVFTACQGEIETINIEFMVDGELYQTKVIEKGGNLVPPEVPAKEGYTGSWDVQAFDNVAENKIISAVYSPKTFYIVFKAQGGNNELQIIDTRIIKYGEGLSVLPEVPEKDGYTGVWNVTVFSSIKSNIEVRAVYTKKNYTMSFVTNGGTAIDSVTTEYGEEINADTTFEGYDFICWHKSANLDDPYTFTHMPSENLTLYAEWRISEYVVNIETQMDEFNSELTKKFGSAIDTLGAYIRTGYVFNGWFLDSDFSIPVSFPYKVKSNITIYADWILDNRVIATDASYFVFNTATKEISANEGATLPVSTIIPSVYNGIVIRGIADGGFDGLAITSVTIPASIKSIGDAAFYNCTALENITFADEYELDYIGGKAFENTIWYNNILTNLSDEFIYIGNVLYKYAGDSVTPAILNTTVSVSPEAFSGQTTLTSIVMPDTLLYIGGTDMVGATSINGAFFGCANLTEILLSENSNLISVNNGSLIGCNSLGTIGIGLNNALAQLFGTVAAENCYLINYNSTVYYIPDTLSKITVIGNGKEIIDYAFSGLAGVTEITIPDTVEVIGDYAFNGCSGLKAFSLPSAVKSIGSFAFNDCGGILTLVISENNVIEYIGESAFENMNIAEFVNSNFRKLIELSSNAFKNCAKLESFISGVQTVGTNVFSGCIALNTLVLPTNTNIVRANELFGQADVAPEGFYLVVGYAVPQNLKSYFFKIPSFDIDEISINDDFLNGFTSLTLISIETGIERIGARAFSHTSIVSVVLPDSVISIGVGAFAACNKLQNFNIYEQSLLEAIPADLFSGCNEALTNLFIPASVVAIDLSAFDNCGVLNAINVDENNTVYYSDNGVLYSKNKLLFYPQDKTNLSYQVLDGTKEIAEKVFIGSRLTSIILPESLETAAENSFEGCEFDAVTMSGKSHLTAIFSGITEISENASIKTLIINGTEIVDGFAAFSSFENVIIGNTVTKIGSGAFYYVKTLKSINISSSVKEIMSQAFTKCTALEIINFEDETTLDKIGFDNFEDTAWYSNLNSDQIIYIGNTAYGYKGNLTGTTLTFRKNTKYIAKSAFYELTNIETVVLNDEITEIGDYAFCRMNNLKSVNFPEGLTTIGRNVFASTNIENIILPSSLKNIGHDAFEGCENLGNIKFEDISTLEKFGKGVFFGTEWLNQRDNGIVYIDDTNSVIYGYYGSDSELIIPNTVTRILPYAFENRYMESIRFSNTIVDIGAYAFEDCEYLENIIIALNGSLTHIGKGAFAYCSALKEFTIPKTLTQLDVSVFEGCEMLHSIVVEESENPVFRFKNKILYNSDYSEIIYVPEGIEGAVTVDNNVIAVPEDAFEGRDSITSVSFGDNLIAIGNRAFLYCEELASVSFSEKCKLESIGSEAFFRCNLKKIKLPKYLKTMAANAFYNIGITFTSNTVPSVDGSFYPNIYIFVPRDYLQLYKDEFLFPNILPSTVKVNFYIDLAVFASYELAYGNTMSEIPAIPAKIGNNGTWDSTVLALIFNTETSEYIHVTDDIKINAKYTKKSYTLTCSNNGISSEVIYEYDAIIGLNAPEDRQNAQFLYWTNNLAEPLPINITRMPAENITLYALWFNYSFAYEEISDSYIFSVDTNNTVYPDNIIIPSSYNGKAVTKIADSAFSGNQNINVVTLGLSIKTIGAYAFYQSSLSEIVISGIGQLISIEDYAFASTHISNIDIPQNLTNVGANAFNNCDELIYIDLFINFNNLGENAFKGCDKLFRVSFIGNSNELITDGATGIFEDCKNLQYVNLPSTLTIIPAETFQGCYKLTQINLSAIVTIGMRAFGSCYALERISLPNVSLIDSEAFSGCTGLRNVFFEDNTVLDEIGVRAFYNCISLNYILIPATTKDIFDEAFFGCTSLKYVVILENGDEYFGSKGLTLGENAIPLSSYIYVNLGLESSQNKWPVYADNIRLYRDIYNNFVYTNNSQNLELLLYTGSDYEIIMPAQIENEYVNSINGDIFIGSDLLYSITLEGGLNPLIEDGYIFRNCRDLELIVSDNAIDGVLYSAGGNTLIAYPASNYHHRKFYEIPGSVTEFADYAFANSVILNTLAIKSNSTVIHENTFEGISDNCKFYVPYAAYNSYKTDSLWSIYSERIYSDFQSDDNFVVVSLEEGIEITQYVGDNANVNIPYSINGVKVVSIGDYAFYNKDVEAVTIPSNIVYIGDYAFAENAWLYSVNIPASVISIGKNAFENCIRLESVIFAERAAITSLQQNTFKGCAALLNIALPYNITEIKQNAFEDCTSLSQVIIPINSVLSSIGEAAFKNCVSLVNINLQTASSLVIIGSHAFNDCDSLVTVTIPESLITICSYAFLSCDNLENLNFIGTSKLAEFGNYSFLNTTKLRSLTVPDSVITIGDYAFEGNTFSSLVFSPLSKLSVIGEYAFAKSVNLKSVYLYSEISSIEKGVFSNCDKLKWIKIKSEEPPVISTDVWGTNVRLYVPTIAITAYKNSWAAYSSCINTLERIYGDYSVTVYGTGVEIFQYLGETTSVNISSTINGQSVYSIGSYAFTGEINTIAIPDSVITIKASAFYNSNISIINLSQYVTSIESNPFVKCYSLAEIIVDESNTLFTVYENVLYNISRTKLISYPNSKTIEVQNEFTIPAFVKEIGKEAFMGAINLHKIVIPDNVEAIGMNAFNSCTALSEIDFYNPSTLLKVEENAFLLTNWYDSLDDGVIYLNSSEVGNLTKVVYSFKGAMAGDTEIILDALSVSILPDAFKNQINLISLSIPYSVNYIGENILLGCSSLAEIVVPGNIPLGVLFGESSYSGSYSAVYTPNNKTYYIPSALTTVGISEGSEEIMDYMFNNCYAVTTVNFPATVEYIGKYAFYASSVNSMRLSSVSCSNSVESLLKIIGINAFRGCNLITNLNIPSSVERINSYAFEGLTLLTSLTFGTGTDSALAYLGSFAFANCINLTALSLPDSLSYVGAQAFYNDKKILSVSINEEALLKEIGNGAFMNCTNLRSFITSQMLEVIGDKAFYGCLALSTFNYDRSLETLRYLGYEVFKNTPFYDGADGITNLPENRNSIIYFGRVAYAVNGTLGGGIIELKQTTVSLSPYIFANKLGIFRVTTVKPESSSVTIIILNYSLENIGRYAFANDSSLFEVTLPDSVTGIDNNAFYNCKVLETITFEDATKLETIGQEAFASTKWYDNFYNNYVNEDPIIYIGNVAYSYKGIMSGNTELKVKDGTVSISPYAFAAQSGIISVQLPSSIKSIGQFAFSSSTDGNAQSLIHTIYIDNEAQLLNNLAGSFTIASKLILNVAPVSLTGTCEYTYTELDSEMNTIILTGEMSIVELLLAYKNIGKMPTVYVPRNILESYSVADGWSYFTDYILPYDGVYEDYAVIYNDEGLDILYYVGSETNIIMNDQINNKNVVGIRSFAFNTKLQSITLGKNLKYIYDYAFAKAVALMSITLPEGLEAIGNSAFSYNTALVNITLPATLISLGAYAFEYCTALRSVKFANGIQSIGAYAFQYCTAIVNMEIPYTVDNIGDYAFNECEKFSLLIMKGSIPPVLGENGLYYRTSLQIYVNDSAVTTYRTNGYWEKYSSRTHSISSLADNLLNTGSYVAGATYQINSATGSGISVYIAPSEMTLEILQGTYNEGTPYYNKITRFEDAGDSKTITMPAASGNYYVYVVIDGAIISEGANILTVI